MAGVSKLKIPLTDEEFDAIFPGHIRKLSHRHFTNFEVSGKAAQWLNEFENLKLLDIGCGVGKFCIAAASNTKHNITGADFRKDYILIANNIRKRFQLTNVHFINRNILDINFFDFNAFYLFNPFLEQIDQSARMDENYETSPLIYSVYENHVRTQLQKMPAGTVVITYYVTPQQMPFNYTVVKTHFDGFLKLWVKR